MLYYINAWTKGNFDVGNKKHSLVNFFKCDSTNQN